MTQIYLRSFLLCLTCVVLLSGCVSLQQSKQLGIKKINELSAFNSVYENVRQTGDSLTYALLWNQLKLSPGLADADFKNAKIELLAFDKNKLKAIWWQGEVQKAELILKGELRDNYFVSKHKRKIIPIPLIYGKLENHQFQLSIGPHNELILDRLENKWGWVFLFLASNNSTKKYEYRNTK